MAFESVAPIDPVVNADGSDANATYATNLQAFVYALFFAFGGITSLNDVLIPKLKALVTTVFPYVGSILILGSLATVDPATLSGAALDAFRGVETQVVVHTYIGLAIALTLLAAVVWLRRKSLVEAPAAPTPVLRAFNLLTRPRFAFGTLCIFLYVGGEVAIGSLIVSYLMQPSVMGLAPGLAGKHVSLYWGGAMVGRFIGAWLLRLFSPGKVLACAAATVIVLLTVSANTVGNVSGWSLLAIGLFNSIMFPTIFTLASEGLGKRAAEGSGVICVAIVGGAVVPLVTGNAADLWGLKPALIVPAVCYFTILAFGWFARRPLRAQTFQAAAQTAAVAPKRPQPDEYVEKQPEVRSEPGAENALAIPEE